MGMEDPAVAKKVLLILFAAFAIGIIFVIIVILCCISAFILFGKAGEQGWTAMVPIYSQLQFSKIATGSYKPAIVLLILYGVLHARGRVSNAAADLLYGHETAMNIASAALSVAAAALVIAVLAVVGYIGYCFAKSFGRGKAFCVLSIFFFPITLIIMGFDKKAEYKGPKGLPPTPDA